MPIGKVINSVFAVKDTKCKRRIVSLMAGRKNCFLSIVLYFRKKQNQKTFCPFTAYSKMHTDLFSRQIDFLIFIVKHSASHYKVSGKL